MSNRNYLGKIRGKVIEVRFSSSGKVACVLKQRGDVVTKDCLLASQDKKQLQAELDKQLADFEKVRAEFEIFNLQKGEPKDDISKYLKSEKQAELNISVKEVELAKAKMDQADLFSPINGVIIDDSCLVPGIYTTPSSNPLKILDTSSYYFEFEIEQKEIGDFLVSKPVEIEFAGVEKTFPGATKPIIPSECGKIIIEVKLDSFEGLFLGMAGKIKI